MEIRVRNMSPLTVKKIDELAKERGLSRQVYLKNHLESFAINDLHNNIIERYEKQLQANMLLLEKTNEAMEEMIIAFKELMEYE